MITQSGIVASYCTRELRALGSVAGYAALTEKDKEAYKASIFQTVFDGSGVVLISYI